MNKNKRKLKIPYRAFMSRCEAEYLVQLIETSPEHEESWRGEMICKDLRIAFEIPDGKWWEKLIPIR